MRSVYVEDEIQPKELLYFIKLWTDNTLFSIEIPKEEFYSPKWLKQIQTESLLLITKTQYELLLQSIKPKKDDSFYFEKIGIHRLHSKYYYAASNCAITADGIDESIKARQEGFNLETGPDNLNLDDNRKRTLENFIEYTSQNYRVFYPIHCISILAVLRYFFKKQGRSAGAILWIDGKVASGKTELAVTMGDFFNRGNNREDQIKHLQTTKSRPKIITGELSKYRNAVFILDDIKKEETSGSRDNTKNITDLVIRSIYTGKTGGFGTDEKPIDATAIITGEYFKEMESTSSRLLYLSIDNFLQEKTNSLQFKKIQKDKHYLAKFMVYFLQWLFRWIDDGSNIEKLETMLTNLQNKAAKSFQGELSTRIVETTANFQLVSDILRLFFKDNQIEEEVFENFHEKSKEALKNLAYATLYKSLNYYPLIKDCFNQALPFLNIKDCRYGNDYLNLVLSNADYTYFLHTVRTDYLYEPGPSTIDSMNGLKKLWLLGLQEEYDGIMLRIKGYDSLLIKTDSLCNLIRGKMTLDMKNWHIKLYRSDIENEKILNNLLDHQFLYGYKRSEHSSSFDKIIQYPKLTMNQITSDYNEDDNLSKEKPTYSMVKINIDCKINCRMFAKMKKPDIASILSLFSEIDNMSSHGGSHSLIPNLDTRIKELDNILTKINRFSDLK